jgi:aryl-alcohol dehydrogenase-like predicted oxidoreductase
VGPLGEPPGIATIPFCTLPRRAITSLSRRGPRDLRSFGFRPNCEDLMTTRRRFLSTTALATTAAMMLPRFSFAADNAHASRPIPSSGEVLPVIGMGTSGSFEVGADATARVALTEVLKRFVDGGGKLIDTAPSYSTAEDVLGDLLAATGLRDRIFLATKLSGVNGRDAGRAQFESTLKRLQTDKVELLQVHNLGDWKTQLAVCRELKAEGKVRYIGLTHFRDQAQDELADIVQAEKPDFLQINYSVTQRAAEKRVFPLARDLGIAVLANRNFDDGALFAKVAGKDVPAWATEAGITSWAQLFLKFALSHPAVTVVIPATGKPDRQTDNLKAGIGPMLDETQRQALIAAVG